MAKKSENHAPKAPAKPKASPVSKTKTNPKPRPLNKSGVADVLNASIPEVTKKNILGLFDALAELIYDSLRTRGSFVLPHIGKIHYTVIPAKPERKGKNPFTGAPVTLKAKPATPRVKFRPAKEFKDKVTGLLNHTAK